MSATVREARMIEQPGHLPPKVAKRPEGVNRNERRTRPAAVATIEVADLRVLQTSPNGLFDSLKRLLASAGRRSNLHFGFPKPVQVAVGVNGQGFVLPEAKGGVRRIAGP